MLSKTKLMVMIDDSDDDDDDNGGIEKTWDTLMVIDDDVKP